MEHFRRISACRIGQHTNLVSVLDLGVHALTGVFPRDSGEFVPEAPLELVWCPESGLVQLAHSFNLSELFGDSYGYRSGLNRSMVNHLEQTAAWICERLELRAGDVVLDIGSNDATLLRSFTQPGLQRIGIDPTGEKFREYYPEDVRLESDFFRADLFRRHFPEEKARVITSLGMFYDLEDPGHFVGEIREILAADGVWHFEQSYLPDMLERTSYDTVCHEHLEYYAFGPIQRLLQSHGLQATDASFNSINGGSLAVTAAHQSSGIPVNAPAIQSIEEREARAELGRLETYTRFADAVARHREELVALIRELRADGCRVIGYGASTKGNVLLQYCGFGPDDFPCIAEVNEDKFGAVTPGSHIPIVSETEAKSLRPDYMLVLPWHFRDAIVERECEYLAGGGKLIFPLPRIEIVSNQTPTVINHQA